MAKFLAYRIKNGYLTFDLVPARLKDDTKMELEKLGIEV